MIQVLKSKSIVGWRWLSAVKSACALPEDLNSVQQQPYLCLPTTWNSSSHVHTVTHLHMIKWQKSFFFNFLLFILYALALVCLCEGVRSWRHRQLWAAMWVLGHLEEQPVLIKAEPPLQPLCSAPYRCDSLTHQLPDLYVHSSPCDTCIPVCQVVY